MKSGVYVIFNLKTGLHYIGSSSNLRARYTAHWWALRKGKHANIHLQRSWDSHGEEAFIFLVLDECSKADLITREQLWIDGSAACQEGYNLAKVAGGSGMQGRHHSEISKAKISASNRTRPRKTHCKRGHEFNDANTRVGSNGARTCRPCIRAYMRERYRVSKTTHIVVDRTRPIG